MSVADHPSHDSRDEILLHAARMAFSPVVPKKVAVAVSGGGDSMAILHAFDLLAATDNLTIEAVTVDHGLRTDAEVEAALVARFCSERNIPHRTLQWDGWNGSGNLMAAARDARYRLIAEWALAHGMDGVVLGHTRDDIAENFLIRLARKSGVDGLAAMDVSFERHGVAWARPFWQQSRDSLRAYLRRHHIDWVEDPTNDDPTFERTRARSALAPLSDVGVSREVLDSVSRGMRGARDALNHYAQIESRRYIVQEHGDLVLRLGLTGPLPAEIKRRLWRATLPWINGAEHPPRNAALFDVVKGLTSDRNATVGGCLIVRKGDDWRVTREYQAVRNLVTKTVDLWDGRWVLDGPHADDLEIRALGEAVRECPDWRATGLPRTSLIATPAIWRGDALIAAPIAGLSDGWSAQIVADFHQHAFAH